MGLEKEKKVKEAPKSEVVVTMDETKEGDSTTRYSGAVWSKVKASRDVTDDASFEFLSTDSLDFIRIADTLKHLTYDANKTFIHWKRSNSSDMKAVINAVEAIEPLLEGNIDDNEYERDLIKKQIEEAFDRIASDAAYYVNNRKPKTKEGQFRQKQVKKILDLATEDKKKLNDSFQFLKNTYGGSMSTFTWKELFKLSRTEKYKEGETGLKISTAGAGTSDLYVFEKGGKKGFFKERDVVPWQGEGAVQKALMEYQQGYIDVMDKSLEGSEEYSKAELVVQLCKVLFTMSQEDLIITISGLSELIQRRKGVWDDSLVKAIIETCSNRALIDLFMRCQKEDKEGNASYAKIPVLIETLKHLGKMENMIKQTEGAGLVPGTDLTARNVATTKLAEILGIDDIVAKSELAQVEVGGKVLDGILMEEAEGITISDLLTREDGCTFRYSPMALKQLSCLQIFDVLCGQTDRHMGNYHVIYSKKDGVVTVEGIRAFDNDLSFGTMTYRDFVGGGTNARCPERIVSETKKIDGVQRQSDSLELVIPCVDFDFAQMVDALTPAYIEYVLTGLVSKREIDAVGERLEGLKKALEKAAKKPGVMIDSDAGWEAFRDRAEQKLSEPEKKSISGISYMTKYFLGLK